MRTACWCSQICILSHVSRIQSSPLWHNVRPRVSCKSSPSADQSLTMRCMQRESSRYLCLRKYSHSSHFCMSRDDSLTSQESNQKNEESNATSSGLGALDAYFSKLKGNSITSNSSTQNSSGQQQQQQQQQQQNTTSTTTGLDALNAYFKRLQAPSATDSMDSSALKPEQPSKEISSSDPVDKQVMGILKELEVTMEQSLEKRKIQIQGKKEMQQLRAAYATNVLVAINVAIFLFGLASPIQTPQMIEVPLPFLFGAKVNDLIVQGQWWRFITSMFLHDGLIHLGLSTWTLLSFGPLVEGVFGTTAFCMIYFVSGIFGDLTSFFHTSLPTVDGTGPVFGLVAALAVYVIQNKEMLSKELATAFTNDVIQKVLVLGALHLAFADSLPVDNWAHIGATVAGAFFAIMITQKLQMSVGMEEMENKMSLFGEREMVKLWLTFALCIGIFSCLYTIGLPAAANDLLTMTTNEFI